MHAQEFWPTRTEHRNEVRQWPISLAHICHKQKWAVLAIWIKILPSADQNAPSQHKEAPEQVTSKFRFPRFFSNDFIQQLLLSVAAGNIQMLVTGMQKL